MGHSPKLGSGTGVASLRHRPLRVVVYGEPRPAPPAAPRPRRRSFGGIIRRRTGPTGFCVNGHERTPENVNTSGCCRICLRARARAFGQTPQGRRTLAERRRRTRYGLAPEQYDALVLEAAGYCPLCGVQDDNTRANELVVEHAHLPGEGRRVRSQVRGLVCGTCNHLLHSVEFRGLDTDWLDAARRYISRPE
jgi:hypothetical protein